MFLPRLRASLVTNAPVFFRLPVKFMPAKVQETFMLQILQKVFQEPLSDGDFEFLEARWLEVHVRDVNFKSYISFQNEKLVVKSSIDKQADVCFSGDLNDLVLIAARKEDPDTLFFQRRLFIEGDTELGLAVKNLMDSVDLEALPKVMRQGLFSLASFVDQGMKDAQVTA